jgi:hypothetical protein
MKTARILVLVDEIVALAKDPDLQVTLRVSGPGVVFPSVPDQEE